MQQMAEQWKNVRIFISSTFRDMHAERDHLVRFVFPDLRDRCAKRRLHLVDIDLRWGVTEAEAQEGKALEICLDEIDRCRPFFIGLLGERYGWVPPAYDVPNESRYDWVYHFEPGYSITALEIYHGVLRNQAMSQRTFFYFRDPSFLSSVPEDQKAAFRAESKEAEAKLKHLKEEIRQRCSVFENYPCTYNGLDGSVFGSRARPNRLLYLSAIQIW
jgi:telomerase protein component 1